MFTEEQEQIQKRKAQDIIDHLPLGIINWYPFKKNKQGDQKLRALLVEGENGGDVFSEFLLSKGLDVTSCSLGDSSLLDISESKDQEYISYHNELKKDDTGKYDYIICIGVLEYCRVPEKMLSILADYLKADGIFLLGTDNRFGLRYFCGDRDKFTGCNFDSIEDYYRVDENEFLQMDGRCYSKEEIQSMIEESGLVCQHCFSVYPSIEAAQLIYRDDTFPNEEISGRYFTDYNHPDTVFLQENQILQSISGSEIFHEMANGFLFELSNTSLKKTENDIKQVTLTMDRGRRLDFATCIGDEKVIKKPLYEEGTEHLKEMVSLQDDLNAHGIHIVNGRLTSNGYEMPFIDAENGVSYFTRLAAFDKKLFFKELDRFIDTIKSSSEVSEVSAYDFLKKNGYGSFFQDADEADLGICLKHCYIDMVPLNCFISDGEFLFYDQEFRFDDYPLNALLDRVIGVLSTPQITRFISRDEMLKRYGLYQYRNMWDTIGNSFAHKLRNVSFLGEYDSAHIGDYENIGDNRLRMNYSESEYEKIFLNIFKDTDRLQVFVFGAGQYAAYFLEIYSKHLKIAGILDNNRNKWGTDFHGKKVFPPDALKDHDPDSYKVIICMLRFQDAYEQAKSLGARHIGVYYRHRSYELPWKRNSCKNNEPVDKTLSDRNQKQAKKYNVGYVAGVFDLFHIGHLNLLRRAKEQCNYLIVGVVSDEQVRCSKKREPVIPCRDRMEIVKACRYVDEVFEIPIDMAGTRDIYNMYHFDVQFSGSDYAQDSGWLANKRYLEGHGSELVFLPYTNGTSSTQIRESLLKG